MRKAVTSLHRRLQCQFASNISRCCSSHIKAVDICLGKDLPLERGGSIVANELMVRYTMFGNEDLPTILLCPSMSNNAFPVDTNTERGWWTAVVGHGKHFGIDLDKFCVVCPCPIGSPFGSVSPATINQRTGKRWGPEFPQVTPADMANVHAMLLDHLGINQVHAVVGGSMGGMQALQFAVRFPGRFLRCAAVASTGQTSPSTVALRTVQRSAIALDPAFKEGWYADDELPIRGMGVARKIGTINYRSRTEFDSRFEWQYDDSLGSFDVERYLEHQAVKFTKPSCYDPNCYLALSKGMDLMDLGADAHDLNAALSAVPPGREVMLLPYNTDVLMPPSESKSLAAAWKKLGVDVHCEVLQSKFGHDAFLIQGEAPPLAKRLAAFLDPAIGASGIRRVTEVYNREVRDVDIGL